MAKLMAGCVVCQVVQDTQKLTLQKLEELFEI